MDESSAEFSTSRCVKDPLCQITMTFKFDRGMVHLLFIYQNL
jgi:hypothetical protein